MQIFSSRVAREIFFFPIRAIRCGRIEPSVPPIPRLGGIVNLKFNAKLMQIFMNFSVEMILSV